MKIHSLTEKAIAVTGLPEGMTLLDAEIVTNQSVIPYGKQLMVPDGEYKSFPNYACIDLPEGNWTILGRAAELTEDDWKRVVERHDLYEGSLYYNYTGDIFFTSALQSGHSLLKAKGLHVTNDPKPDIEDYLTGRQYQHFLNIWQSANELTNPLILIK